jgi:membrane protein YqaA with SNARE-associated domain
MNEEHAHPRRRRWIDRALHLLATTTSSRWYGPLTGAIAFALTLTASAPFTAVLVAALWLTPHRWKALVVFSSLGGALGGIVLVSGFQHLGWGPLYSAFPDLAAAPTWQRIVRAIEDYGVAALAVVAAAPMPQTPALIIAASAKLNPVAVIVALFAGKVVKYSVVAWLVSVGSPLVDRLIGGHRRADEKP